jgi:hypothetical protein
VPLEEEEGHMDQVERETASAKRLRRREMDPFVSVVRSSWPGWIRTHIPDEDDFPRRKPAVTNVTQSTESGAVPGS